MCAFLVVLCVYYLQISMPPLVLLLKMLNSMLNMLSQRKFLHIPICSPSHCMLFLGPAQCQHYHHPGSSEGFQQQHCSLMLRLQHMPLIACVCLYSKKQGSQGKLDDWDDWGDSPSKSGAGNNASLPVSSRVSVRCVLTSFPHVNARKHQ